MSLVENLCRSQPDTPFLSKDSALTAFGFSFLLQYQLHTFGSSVTLPFSTEIIDTLRLENDRLVESLCIKTSAFSSNMSNLFSGMWVLFLLRCCDVAMYCLCCGCSLASFLRFKP
jgi:hypothetical protein